jgi:hypothetical protein
VWVVCGTRCRRATRRWRRLADGNIYAIVAKHAIFTVSNSGRYCAVVTSVNGMEAEHQTRGSELCTDYIAD